MFCHILFQLYPSKMYDTDYCFSFLRSLKVRKTHEKLEILMNRKG